jgi:hypothetical protein
MSRLLPIVLAVFLFSVAASAQLENPRFGGSPFAKAGSLLDVPENAKVYIVVQSARGDKTIESMTEKIKKETSWTLVENPDDADIAIQTEQTRKQGWRKEYSMRVYIRKGSETPLVWQNVRLNEMGTSAGEKLIGAFIEDWKSAQKKKDK